MFIANWFVTEDHARESGLWVHDNIDIGEACALVGEVPEVSKKKTWTGSCGRSVA